MYFAVAPLLTPLPETLCFSYHLFKAHLSGKKAQSDLIGQLNSIISVTKP